MLQQLVKLREKIFGISKKSPSDSLAEKVEIEREKPVMGDPRVLYFNSVLRGNAVKAVMFCIIGFVLVVGNFFVEAKFAVSEEVKKPEFSAFDYTKDNIIPDDGVIRFSSENTENSVDIKKSSQKEGYIFALNSGKLWGNFAISNAKVDFLVGKIVVIPDHAAFSLSFDGKAVELSVFDGDVYVGVLDDNVIVTEYVDGYSPIFVNRLLVPRGSRITVVTGKLDEKIASLLYSKLVKEFKYSIIPSTEKDSEWVKQNLSKDSTHIESVRQKISSDITFGGRLSNESELSDFIFWVKENLTFFPEKKNSMIFDHLFSYLNDAIYLADDSDESVAEEMWNQFSGYLSTLTFDEKQKADYVRKFDYFADVLSVFAPGDPQYFIFEKMLDKKFSENRDVYKVVNMFWRDVYDGLDMGNSFAEDALNRYYKYFKQTLGKKDNLEFYVNYITYNNQLFDNLLFNNAVFYKDGYFAIKDVLEKELLSLYQDGRLKEELSQYFISNKISFLKRLMKNFFAGDVSVAVAKEILSRLVEEVDKLMPGKNSHVAVTKLFESQLKQIGDFWGYLNSPEYHSSKTYGLTHEEKYQTYLKEKDKIWSFVNIREDVLGDTVKEITIKDVEKEISDVFANYPDVTDLKIVDLTDVEQRYVKVKAMIGGYPFEASFDRDDTVLKDVFAYGELVSDRSVPVDKLNDLLINKFADLAGKLPESTEELTEETLAQRAARLYVSEKVAGSGFAVGIDNISIVDELNAVYRVSDIYIETYDSTRVTFDFSMNGEKAKNLLLMIDGKPVVFDGEYTLEQVRDMVLAEGDFALEEGDLKPITR